MSDRSVNVSSPRFWIPMIVLALVGALFTWLNDSPWWALLIVALVVAGVGMLAPAWWKRNSVLQVGAWTLATALVAAVAVVAYPLPHSRDAGAGGVTPAVDTEQGPVTGVYNDARSVEIFAGIPYAKPPVGDLRWKAPQPLERRTEPFAADHFSAAPIQQTQSFLIRAMKRFVKIPITDTFLISSPVSEDSLYLNVWRSSTTKTGSDAPVIVYVPGGAYITGSGALPVYDGAALAERGDVIVVTINYRLGVFGFLAGPELDEESASGTSGNQGMLDQIAALQWVNDNIESFGGDPDRVTVAGESAGGQSVCIIGATPLARGLVDGIIGESGSCMGTVGDTADGDMYDAPEVAREGAQKLSDELGGATLEEMRAMPTDRIVEAASKLDVKWRPSIDNHLLPQSPTEIYAAGEQNDVPLLLGSNKDEASLQLAEPLEDDPEAYARDAEKTYGDLAQEFLALYPGQTSEQVIDSTLHAKTDQSFTRAMRAWAHAAVETGDSEVYQYYFTRTPPEAGLERYGAYHGAELMYAYDNLGADGHADYTEVDYRIRDEMSAHWLNFATNGNPNDGQLVSWESVNTAPNKVKEFGESIGMVPRPRADAVDFWMRYTGPTE